jgi:hypothetical protein
LFNFRIPPDLTEDNQDKQSEDSHLPNTDATWIPPNEFVRSMTMKMITMAMMMMIKIVVVVW